MKLSCTRDNLYRGLSTTSHVGGKNINLPILGNVLLKVGGGALKLTATNLEMAISCLVRGKIEQEGEFTVPAKLFSDFVSLLPSGQVDLEVVAETLHVRSGSHKTKITGLPASEFPLIPPMNGGVIYRVAAQILKAALLRVLFAVATNESRPELTGIYTSFNEPAEGIGKVIFAATDTFRLSEVVAGCSGSTESHAAIIPARALAEFSRILSVFKDDVEVPEFVEILFSDNQVMLRYGSVELTSRTIEGTYPNYRQIIPNRHETEACLPTEALVRAMKAASLFARTGLYDVLIELDADGKQLRVTGSDAARGENTSASDAIIVGSNNRVAINYRYLLDGLTAVGEEEARFQMIDANNPCVLLPASSSTGSKFVYIVMPINQ